MKHFFALCTLLLCVTCYAQDCWAPANQPFSGYEVRCLYSDEEADLLWVAGDIRDGFESWKVMLLAYDGNEWVHYGYFDSQVLDVIRYQGKIYVTGFFSNYNDTYCKGVAVLENGEFVPSVIFNQDGGAGLSFRIINEELYVVGTFDEYDGIDCNGICKFDGNSWTMLEFLDNEFQTISDIFQFEDRFFVGGNINSIDFNGELYNDLFMQEGDEWVPSGVGLPGQNEFVVEFGLIEDELYVFGSLNGSTQNPGNGLRKWDGNGWTNVGYGITGLAMNSSSFAPVRDVYLTGDSVFIGGAFDYTEDVLCPNLTLFHDNQFCCLGGELGPVSSIAMYQDTLYIGTTDDADGVFVNNLAKYVGDLSDLPCTAVSIEEPHLTSLIQCYPNPFEDQLRLQNLPPNAIITVNDPLGRVKYAYKNTGHELEIDTRHWSRGVHLITILHEDHYQTFRMIK